MPIHDNQIAVECNGINSTAWKSNECWVLMEYINSKGITELGWDFRCFNVECTICYREVKDLRIVAIVGTSRSLEYVNIKK
jgi:hypothetical protein